MYASFIDFFFMQQDIMRGRNMVDSLFQGQSGNATHQAIMTSDEYLSQAQRNFNNMEDGYYISPAFLDKVIQIPSQLVPVPVRVRPAKDTRLRSVVTIDCEGTSAICIVYR